MALRRFDRIYYSLEKDGNQTLICPLTRLRYDEDIQSPVIQKPLRPGTPIIVELWQMAEQSDIDAYEWGDPVLLTVDGLIDELILNSGATPWGIEGIDAEDLMDEGSVHSDGTTSRTFLDGEEVTLDDVRVCAFEDLDADAADRVDDYLWLTGPDDRPVGMILFPTDANWLCRQENKRCGINPYDDTAAGKFSSSPMSTEGVSRRLDFTPFRYAVLAKYPSSREWVLAGALDTKERAETIADCLRMNHEEFALGEVAIKEIVE